MAWARISAARRAGDRTIDARVKPGRRAAARGPGGGPGRRSRARTSRGGFTLIEFLVAMAMLAIIMPALTLSFRTALSASDRIDRRSQETSEARAVLDVITEDLESAFMPSTQGKGWFIGTDSSSGNAPADSLAFTTFSGRPSLATLAQGMTPADTSEPMSRYQQINYSLEPGMQAAAGALLRDFASPPGDDQTAVTDEQVLATDVLSLNFDYYDGSQWLDSWDTTQNQQTSGTQTQTTADTGTPPIPLAVRVTIQFLMPEGPRTYVTTVELPMYNASNEKIEQDTPTATGGATAGGATAGTSAGATSAGTGGTTAGTRSAAGDDQRTTGGR